MLKKSIQCSLFLSLAASLSSCMWQTENRDAATQQPLLYDKAPVTATKAPVKASSAQAVKTSNVIATEPVQKSTPGPKRAAAPQLPVIQ